MSSDSDETQFEPELSKSDSKRACFIKAVKDHTIVLNRSISSNMISAKEKAWMSIKDKYETSIGQTVTLDQLKRILNNLKTETKKKIDKSATGNRKIKLSQWENDFVEILTKFEQPNFRQVNGAITVGMKSEQSSKPSCSTNLSSEASVKDQEGTNKDQERIVKKRKTMAFETKESVQLSTNELQRLVLIEQLNLIRTQKRREELEIRNLEAKLSTSNRTEDPAAETDFDLTEFL